MTDDEFVDEFRKLPGRLQQQMDQFEKSRQAVIVACEHIFSASCDDILGDLSSNVSTASEIAGWS